MALDFSNDHLVKLSFLRPIPGKEEELVAAVYQYIEQVKVNEPDTLSWFLMDVMEPCAEDGGKEFCILTRYKDQKSFEAHDNAPYYKDIKNAMASNLRTPVYTRPVKAMGGFITRAYGSV